MAHDGDYEVGNFGGGIRTVWGNSAPSEPEQKRAPTSGRGHIVGIVATFTRLHRNHFKPADAPYECYVPGCFDRSLASKALIRILIDHRSIDLMGAPDPSTGVLQLCADEASLFFSLNLNGVDHKASERLLVEVKSGARVQMSCGYRVVQEELANIDGTPIRLLRDLELHDVSFVQNGACPGTFASFVPDGDFNLVHAVKSHRMASERASFMLKGALANLSAAVA